MPGLLYWSPRPCQITRGRGEPWVEEGKGCCCWEGIVEQVAAVMMLRKWRERMMDVGVVERLWS